MSISRGLGLVRYRIFPHGRNWDALRPLVEQAFAAGDLDEWLESLNKYADFPFSLVREYADVAEDPSARVWRLKKKEVFK